MAQEKIFENKIKSYLKSIGAYFIKTHGDRFSKVGTPDIIACVNGRFVAIEVKAENGKPSELQLYHLEQITNAGGISYLLYPKDFEQFKKDMEELRYVK
jgi:Holliday junction resolvase